MEIPDNKMVTVVESLCTWKYSTVDDWTQKVLQDIKNHLNIRMEVLKSIDLH